MNNEPVSDTSVVVEKRSETGGTKEREKVVLEEEAEVSLGIILSLCLCLPYTSKT